ncbi:MAG TPA: hypothetical protein VJJ52_02780 [Candidatus Nanoarchaeia archaeon]|nr:hypothetical protein [Candidatus Nanoarchaeia archaeon]
MSFIGIEYFLAPIYWVAFLIIVLSILPSLISGLSYIITKRINKDKASFVFKILFIIVTIIELIVLGIIIGKF